MSKLVIDQNPERECWTNTYIYESKYIYGDKRSKQIHIWRHIHTRQIYSTRKLTERTWSHWHAIAKKKCPDVYILKMFYFEQYDFNN